MKKGDFQLETKNLILRKFRNEDAHHFYKMNNDPEVMSYTGDLPFKSIQEARSFIQNYKAYALWGYGRWAMILKSNQDFIGFCGFKYNEEGLIDLGFRLIREYWGMGFATEAAMTCLTYGFDHLGFEYVIGRAARKNLASIRVLQKLGMKYWKDGTCGDIQDSVYYKIEKMDFINRLNRRNE